MGLLSSIAAGINKVAQVTGAAKVLDFATVAFNHPIQTAVAVSKGSAAVKTLETKVFSQPLGKQIAETVTSTIGYGGVILSAGAISAAAKAGTLGSSALSVGSSLIPKSTAGKVVAAVAVPAVVSAVIQNPIGAVNTAGKVIQAEKDLGGVIANPSLASGEQFLKDHPVLTASTAGAALLTAGFSAGSISSIISTHFNTAAVKKNTEATIEGSTGSSNLTNTTATTATPGTSIIINNNPPVTAAADNLTTSKTSAKKKKSSSKAKKKKSKAKSIKKKKSTKKKKKATKRKK